MSSVSLGPVRRSHMTSVPFTAILTFGREIKAGECYDCSSDMWSLGTLILWILDPSGVRLTGSPFFVLVQPMRVIL